jgi:hypothetical protein
MNVSIFERKVAEIKRTQERFITRRQHWNTKAKPEILDWLTSINEKAGINFKIDSSKKLEALDAIYFHQPPSDYGLRTKTESHMQNHPLRGAVLEISQNLKGKVDFIYYSPYFDELEHPVTVLISTHEPDEIHQSVVGEALMYLLKETADWYR